MNYVVAVSGGVDSIVLLDALFNNRLSELITTPNPQLPTSKLIVAHFDHGIREDSTQDEEFVRGVAGEYGLQYEAERVALGSETSEEKAREMRYNFLRRCCKKYNATLITAHHQDDVLETMIINLIRGTNWRGLAPMSDANSEIQNFNHASINSVRATIQPANMSVAKQTSSSSQPLRPLLTVPKVAILKYAEKHSLRWREDSTNTDQKYLRNYVRHTLLPKMLQQDPEVKNKLLHLNAKVTEIKNKIATELQKAFSTNEPRPTVHEHSRYSLIMLPRSVAHELIYHILTILDPAWHPTSLQLKRALHFIKTAAPEKQLEVGRGLKIIAKKHHVQFINQ